MKTKKHVNLRKKTKKMKNRMINTRNQPCSRRSRTVCCPHQKPDKKGRYAATNEKTVLEYKGKKYLLHTCCLACSKSMNRLSHRNLNLFENKYKPVIKNNKLILSNQWTGKPVQQLKCLNK